MAPTTIVSAPGKVLLAGGYLVLEPAFTGTVVSTSSRFYTVVKEQTRAEDPSRINVQSPQFVDAAWAYDVSFEPAVSVVPLELNKTKNKFVHLALQTVISLASEVKTASHVQSILSRGIDIAIVGDNDFYSQRAKLESLNLPRTLGSLSQISHFIHTGVPLSNVHKTGLGSSAALITSLVSALLVHFSVIPSDSLSADDSEGRRLAHNTAQYVHCLAQGKIGSGFDVAAAAFGSQLYTRFDPFVLQGLLNSDSSRPQSLLPTLSPSNPGWNYKVEPFKLPPLTRLMLADVDAGSDTPSLVSKVLAWRKAQKEESDALWNSLHQLNLSLAKTLEELTLLHEKDPENYTSAVKYISSLQPIQWTVNPWQPPAEQPMVEAFYKAHRITQEVRGKMREMGTLAGVPIEPIEQTRLLDACVAQAGVIGGGVPGAGGYDAIWLLVCDPIDSSPDQPPIDRVEYIWRNYKELDVSPLAANESFRKGAQSENLQDIPGLEDAIA
ncbi:hypothetical protein AX16_002085 [Volvariella volvacea WC 439]|nr:hypothetical protein AX16_002085 [Volvariella volvacea WC 439]